ncbi:MAG TPA: hypothetical protein VGQ13_00040 [Nitrososphaera sp.]|jgi:hypothetical protein|nr:hypothetical protein [Nitrososphaera sp.]
MTTVIDPVRLAGLKQAVYVMERLVEGHSEEQIAIALGDDKQLVTMWMLFLEHNHWIETKINGWSITAKGKTWCGKRRFYAELKQRSNTNWSQSDE